jgi:hypothetical protein
MIVPLSVTGKRCASLSKAVFGFERHPVPCCCLGTAAEGFMKIEDLVREQ